MRAPDDVVAALAAIGFEAEHVAPADEPSYTTFKRGNEMFDICFAVQAKAMSIFRHMDQLNDELENRKTKNWRGGYGRNTRR